MKRFEQGQAYLDISGSKIFCEQHLADTSSPTPVIVFLHHALGSVAQWKDFPEKICRISGCHVLAYDRPGHGNASPVRQKRTANYLHTEAFEMLPEVLRQCGITQPVLYGHSDGGSIALLYAARFETRAVISEAAHTFVEPVTLEGIRETSSKQEALVIKGLQKYHGDKSRPLFEAWSETWLSAGFEGWNIIPYLPHITCPVFAVQGENDQYGSRLQIDTIREHCSGPVETLMIQNCGHMPHRTHTELMAAKTDDFLRKYLDHFNIKNV